ncbi:hypothetical protein [Antribacter gilvus]|uniref:hypothetical protein n=1 Tax=Antribacter gilvus TaxID=2304675 RepID=UPI0013DF3D6E|nr:hypothetical protein [Antribacter gilvus]
MGDYLNVGSTLMCPHGGTVTAVPSSTKVRVDGQPVVLSSDTFMVAACPFMIGPTPSPCLQVSWQSTVQRTDVGGTKPLAKDSVGMCKAATGAVQGTVMIQSTQAKVGGL